MPLTKDNDTEFNNLSENNYNKIESTVSKVGYSDGITEGRDSVFQKGFDIGYENGLSTGFELAKYKAFYDVIRDSSVPKDVQSEKKVFEQLNIPKASDKSNFIGNGNDVPSLSQQQLDYINNRTTLFAKDLPIATDLFSR